uniref:Transglutaminase-like domain-containing protein n=1 Tax=Spongospora subterranea TaxID=70186 RepID=A0A0H5QYF4_9EUKA|eukprot:CRZ06691.1 hypothetical protein [Spongospora subterranea]
MALSSLDVNRTCSRVYLSDVQATQSGGILDRDAICIVCLNVCKRGQNIPRRQSLEPFACQCGTSCSFSSRIDSRSEVLDLNSQRLFLGTLKSNYETQTVILHEVTKPEFANRIRTYQLRTSEFENETNLKFAQRLIPHELLLQRGKERGSDALPEEDELVFQLLYWFKHELFQWVNRLQCPNCLKESTEIAVDRPQAEEAMFLASTVELHRCTTCNIVQRFPRYNNPAKILREKRGRCGEWALGFTLCCRAVGLAARLVVDWTDHVWTEVYSVASQRWVHCDSCENRYDAPLLYEAGWGKKLTYCIAFCSKEVRDVTRRYTTQYASDVLPRRSLCSEEWLERLLSEFNAGINMTEADRQIVKISWEQESAFLLGDFTKEKVGDLPGRESGSLAWRRARGEVGSTSDQAQTQTAAMQPIAPTVSAEVQSMIVQYYQQMSKGCQNPLCNNIDFCCTPSESKIKDLPHPERLRHCLMAARQHKKAMLCRYFQCGSKPS